MDENKVRQIARQEAQSLQNTSAFEPTSVQYHTHNGVDSPFVYSSTTQYTGYVPFDGNISGSSTSGFVFFPQGWTAELAAGSLIYTVRHNLNTDFYTVMFCTTTGDGLVGAAPISICYPDRFEVAWFDDGGTNYQNDFHFLLTVVNNGLQSVPLYTVRGGLGA